MVEDETEGVARRIEVDPKVLPTGLGVRLRRADGEDRLLTGFEISDVEVEVELLGTIIARPGRWLMTWGQLEGDRRSLWADQLHPVVLGVGFAPKLPARHGGVEPRKLQRSRAIESDETESSDAGHGRKVAAGHHRVLTTGPTYNLQSGFWARTVSDRESPRPGRPMSVGNTGTPQTSRDDAVISRPMRSWRRAGQRGWPRGS